MLPKMVAVFLLTVVWITASVSAAATRCPIKGKIGTPLPDIFQGIDPDSGYHIRLELTGAAHTFTEIEDYFNGASKHGRIQVHDDNGSKDIYYYSMTQEAFTVDKDKRCDSRKLDITEKVAIVNSWLQSDDIIKELSSALEGDALGPGALLAYVNSIRDQAQDLSDNGATIDGQQVNQWFYCVNDNGPYIDFNFNTKNEPINMILSFPGRPELTHTINFVSMEPVIPLRIESIAYPWGFGCTRSLETSKIPKLAIPKFAQGDNFFMEIEAAVFLSSADTSILQSARVAKAQGIYSYDLISDNQTVRIVHDSIVAIDYNVDPITGKCTEQTSRMAETSYISYLRWPYTEDEMYNLLDPSIFELDSVQYMGQTDTDFGKMDIYEKTVFGFFVNDEKEYYDALVTYFFPAMDTGLERRQAPQKIIIKPRRHDKDLDDPSYVTKIEMVFIEYREGEDNIDYTDLFDISGCYDQPGQYTWFQIVFSDIPTNILSFGNQEELIRTNFEKAISFIPRIRLPETRITFFGPNIYVTCKLLERPAFQYFYSPYPDSTIENPSKILIREHEEDCGEICSEDKNCMGFAYCSNLECRILSSTTVFPEFKDQIGCTEYAQISFLNDAASVVEKNLMKSSKVLLHEVKLLIERGQFYFDSPALSAEDIFIVTGPDMIGGIDDEFTENNQIPNGDAFSVSLNDHRLTDGEKFLGVTYQQCLIYCANNDACYAFSYCPNRDGGECILSNPRSQEINGSQHESLLSTGCNILSKKYTSYFRKLPGRSLIRSARLTMKNIDLDECAIACELAQGFTCESFDYCASILNSEDKKSEPACFLHSYHVAKDPFYEINGTVWNWAAGECDHYARKHSQDYKQYVGRRLKVNLDLVGGQADDVTLENCAINCDTVGENCQSFEYCEIPARGSNQAKTTCRYSKLRPRDGADQILEVSLSQCSVYVAKNKPQKSGSGKKSNLGLAMGLGSFMMIAGFVGAAIGTHFYFKRQTSPSS